MSGAVDFRVVYLERNMGHGNARRRGLSECRNNLVALMDADDISLPTRFEKQLERFAQEPNLSIVGGQITEFSGTPDHITGIRQVPLDNASIKEYMKKRCPMNQVTVMFKNSEVEQAGGYIDWYCEEDYYLWARMALNNCTFGNVKDVLVNVRVGDEMSARRGGLKYFRSEAKMQKYLLANHFISLPRYCYNLAIRFAGEVLAPNFIRVRLFRLFRKSIPADMGIKSEITGMPQSKRNDYPPFSVSMCVYGGDNAKWFDEALGSILDQTVRPQEIVLVVDGPVPGTIQTVIDKYKQILKDMQG